MCRDAPWRVSTLRTSIKTLFMNIEVSLTSIKARFMSIGILSASIKAAFMSIEVSANEY